MPSDVCFVLMMMMMMMSTSDAFSPLQRPPIGRVQQRVSSPSSSFTLLPSSVPLRRALLRASRKASPEKQGQEHLFSLSRTTTTTPLTLASNWNNWRKFFISSSLFQKSSKTMLFNSNRATSTLSRLDQQRPLDLLSSMRNSVVTKEIERVLVEPPRESQGHRYVSPLDPLTEPATKRSIPWIQDKESYGEFQPDVDWAFTYQSTTEAACTSYLCDDIEGTIPRDLSGCYYKIGPGNLEREGRRFNHVFDGDGFIASFSFHEGKVRYAGNFVETEFFLEEKKQDKILYRSLFGTERTGGPLRNAFDTVFKNPANTNIEEWGGRLFAFHEAGRPYKVDAETLCTKPMTGCGPFKDLGPKDCRVWGITFDDGGILDKMAGHGRTFTAHPHIVDDNTMVAFKSQMNPLTGTDTMEFIEYDREWNEKSKVRYTFQGGPAPHDFSVGDNHYCFFQNRIEHGNVLPFLLGLKAATATMSLSLREPATLHLIPRSSSGKPMQIPIPNYFNVHNVEKVEEDEKTLTVYSTGWDLSDERYFPKGAETAPFFGAFGGEYPDYLGGEVPPSFLYQTVVDLETGTLLRHQPLIPGLALEFPCQDAMNRNFIYCPIGSTTFTALPFTGVCKIDVQSGEVSQWWAEGKVFTTEMESVPKRNGEKGTWLLSLFHDASTRRASLAIFDSEKIEEGPVARINLRHHITNGIHGSFVSHGSPNSWQ